MWQADLDGVRPARGGGPGRRQAPGPLRLPAGPLADVADLRPAGALDPARVPVGRALRRAPLGLADARARFCSSRSFTILRISALGIGVTDQSLQQILLNPVLGKILVLVSIILFLQWRPQGLFVTKSRSLES